MLALHTYTLCDFEIKLSTVLRFEWFAYHRKQIKDYGQSIIIRCYDFHLCSNART